MAQARLREALNAGSGSQKEKGPPVADGILSVTPDTQEALEWRSKKSIIDSAGTSSSYLEDETGPKPSELYGKFTWKIENFSELNKRELRSTIFEVGSYKWYILVYPQGCDVCNHLSLFLCVADYDKLLPGWSHFAQFTIAVVNKDPKKSKYSDTLHRFCKKEHDWGWKKFMELNKVLEGFTVSNTLVIKAQVQVIRDRPSAPFRCLEAQYRRELVRVYLSNVETLARKFVEEKREALLSLRNDGSSFLAFWASMEPRKRRQMATASGEVILKGVVKRFFNEKEVTSTLVMDALVSGVKQIEECSRLADSKKGKKEKDKQQPLLSVDAEKNEWMLRPDLMSVIDCAVTYSIPAFKDEGKPLEGLAVRNAQDVEDYSSNYVERDERRLADLGRRAVEIFAVSHILRELESVHSMEESIKRQDALIKEEEENESLEAARSAARSAAEREKKARKKERQREKKAAEQAKKEAEDAERLSREAARKAEADEKAAAEASARKQEEEQREAERRAALKERAESYKAQEASRLQEAAESAAKAKQEEQARLERQERPAAEPSVHAGEPSTAGPAKLSRASSSDESLAPAAPRIPNGVPQAHDSEDGHSLCNAGDGVGTSSADTSDNEERARLGRRSSSQTERQGSAGPIRGHVEYLQAQLAASNSALAAARAEVGKLQAALSTAQRELSARTREANESSQQLEARALEVSERSEEIAQLHAVIAELRQQVQTFEQQKAAATPSVVTLGDLRGSVSNDVDISVSSRPASRSSSLDTYGLDQQQLVQARAGAQAANMQKVRTGCTSQSTDSTSDSPHTVREASQAAEVGSPASSSISNFSHRQGHAWTHTEQQRQHGRQPQANGQCGPPGRAARAGSASQGSNGAGGGGKDSSSAALAAASAAAAAALRPHNRGSRPAAHAGAGGANGTGQGPAGQQHSQPVPIGGANASSAAFNMLNGNAAAFHPSSGTPNGRPMAESPTGSGLQGSGQPKNGVISYRNAAAGTSGGHMVVSSPCHRGMSYPQGHQPHAHSPMSHHQPPPPPPGPNPKANANGPAPSQPPPPPHPAPKHGQEEATSGLSRGGSNASSHATNGVAAPAESSNGYLPSMMYGANSGMQGQTQQPDLTSSYTPVSDKKKDKGGPPQESPGLDDFAHMGMITNLLE